jgi:hypothetical protein
VDEAMRQIVPTLLMLHLLAACSSGASAQNDDTLLPDAGEMTAGAGGDFTTGTPTGGVPGVADCSDDVARDLSARLEDSTGEMAVPLFSLGINGEQIIDLAGTLSRVAIEVDALRLELVTEVPETWSIVLSAEDLTPILEDLEPLLETPVSLSFHYRKVFQANESTGFLLSDASGLVMAAECGPHVQALTANGRDFRAAGTSQTLDVFTVEKVTPICRARPNVTCAPNWVYTELDFRGDTTTTVGLSEDGAFIAAGLTYGARNAGAGYAEREPCSDYERASEWLVWRKAE